jgi:hypothetical protein
MLVDPVDDPHQALLRNDEGIAVHEEHFVLALHILGGEKNVAQDNAVILDGESLVLVSPAKAALVVAAAEGYLEEDAVGFAGRPDAHPFVMHAFICHNRIFSADSRLPRGYL